MYACIGRAVRFIHHMSCLKRFRLAKEALPHGVLERLLSLHPPQVAWPPAAPARWLCLPQPAEVLALGWDLNLYLQVAWPPAAPVRWLCLPQGPHSHEAACPALFR